MKSRKITLKVIFTTATILSTIVLIVLPGSTANLYAERITFECRYTHTAYLSSNAREFDPNQFKIEKNESPFKLRFVIENDEKAYMIGNVGQSEVPFVVGDEAITFIEVLSIGGVNVTTISLSNRNGLSTSAHSRNTFSFTTFTPSQQYGMCRRT